MKLLLLVLVSDPRSEIIAVAEWQQSELAAISRDLLHFPTIKITGTHADKKREDRSEEYIRCEQRG